MYDYFLDAKTDENANEAHGYHIIDENDRNVQQEDDEDLEELDEEEKQERYENMLYDFKKRIEREDKPQ